MITVKFFGTDPIEGFEAFGHGTINSDDTEGRIICSAVSSAVYLVANTLSEILGAGIEASDDGEVLSVRVISKKQESQTILRGLKLHLSELSRQYEKSIKIISEV